MSGVKDRDRFAVLGGMVDNIREFPRLHRTELATLQGAVLLIDEHIANDVTLSATAVQELSELALELELRIAASR